MSKKQSIGKKIEICFCIFLKFPFFRLLELTPDLLKRIESGTDLIIRGDDEDSVVLCTEDATFDVKMCTTR